MPGAVMPLGRPGRYAVCTVPCACARRRCRRAGESGRGVSMMTAAPVPGDRDYPRMAAEINRVEPAPRRVRAFLGGELIFDTTRAHYVWEVPYYPQYYIPVEDVDPRFLVDEKHEQSTRRGTARRHGLHAGSAQRPGAVRVFGADAIAGVAGTAR